MPVQNKLQQGIEYSSFTHENPLVQTVANERQPERSIQLNVNGWTYKDEWIGTTQEINCLLYTTIGGCLNTYVFKKDENFSIDRQRGDLSKLTHSYKKYFELTDEQIQGYEVDNVEETAGITPWTIRTETTDIGALEYWMIVKNISTTDAKTIKRDRIALWENSPIVQKSQFKYKVTNPANLKEGYVTVDRNPEDGSVDSPKTLEFVQWYVENGRDKFPLTTVVVTHNRLVKGTNFASFKKGERPVVAVKDDITGIIFPATQFGKELNEIPELPDNYQLVVPNSKWTLRDWNLQNYNGKSVYLETLEYISYPEVLPNPIDPVPYYNPTTQN
jgi:hypothetical protein